MKRIILNSLCAAAVAVLLAAPAVWATSAPAPGVEVDEATKANLNRMIRTPVTGGWVSRTLDAAAVRANALPGEKAVTGTFTIPVITTEFNNVGAPYASGNLQTELFDGPWPTGTMTDFYTEISYGLLTVTGTVFNWFSLANNDTFYEGPSGCNGLCGSARTGDLIADSLTSWDGSVDFGQYDNDGPDGVPNSGDDDGLADFVAFVHPEAGGECGNNNIWSHRWTLHGWTGSVFTTNDPSASGGNIRVNVSTFKLCFKFGVVRVKG